MLRPCVGGVRFAPPVLSDTRQRQDARDGFSGATHLWNDYERNEREEPAGMPQRTWTSSLNYWNASSPRCFRGWEKPDPATAEFYRTEIPALIAAARKTAGIEKAAPAPVKPKIAPRPRVPKPVAAREKPKAEPRAPTFGAADKIFTAEAAAAAREISRREGSLAR
jgi:hypothetical protein